MMAILRAVARIVRRMRQRHANRAANFAYLARQPSTTYYEDRDSVIEEWQRNGL